MISKPITEIKKDFPIFRKKLVYLDNASTSQKPQQVIDSVKKFYEEDNANVHRGIYRLSQRSTIAYEKAHEIVAKFINADFREIIFTRGTTESLNLLAYSLGRKLQEGDEIVLTEMEHHSNLVPWQQLAKEKKLVLKFIPVKEDFTLDRQKARRLITEKTKIVAVVHTSNMLGTVNPVKEISKIAHDAGSLVVLDAAQSVPHIPVDVKEIDCDFLAFSGHKMCGPTGIGVLYGKKELLEKMDPFHYGGDMIREVGFNESSWNNIPWKFEAGTPNIAGAIGLASAIEYLQRIGMNEINRYCQELTEYALKELKKVSGLKIIGPLSNRGPAVSFTLEGIHPHDLSEILDRDNIAIRGGHHCVMPLHSRLGISGTGRVSFYFYNDKVEIDKLIEGVRKAQEIFR